MPDFLASHSPASLAAGAAAVLLGGLARGSTGFGGALVMVPLLAAVFSPAASVALALLIESAGYADLVRQALPRMHWRRIAPLTVAAIAAAPVGVYAVVHTDSALMTRAIAGLILVLAALLLSGWRYHGAPGWAATAGVGIVSGLLDGAAGVPGPPVALFLYGGPQPAAQVRDDLAGFFLLLDVATLGFLALQGALHLQWVWLGMVYLPISVVANALGLWLARRFPERVLRRAALLMVVAVGLALLARPA